MAALPLGETSGSKREGGSIAGRVVRQTVRAVRRLAPEFVRRSVQNQVQMFVISKNIN
jgi:hypothetical protein